MNILTEKANAVFQPLEKYCPENASGVYDCREGCFMRLYKNVSETDFFACRNGLLNGGFALCQETETNGNRFAALKKDVCATLYYTPFDKSMRMTASENDAFPSFVPQSCGGTAGTAFYAFENDHTIIDCGMCLLVQCPDYSFFVVDSGHYFQFNDNDRLYNFMRERTPEGQKVVINGWFITHAHTDHVCKLIDFIKYNTRDVIIEGFYQNLLSAEYPNDFGNHEEKEIAEKLFALLEAYPAPVYKLHTGMKFYVRNLSFAVLCTHEDLFPEHIEDYNDSSAVLMMTAEGSRVFIPGDAAVLASKSLEERFGHTLQCDIAQIAHHGHTGLSERCYELLNADTVVFPVTRIMFEQDIDRRSANRRAIELASRYFITGDGTVCVPLPYNKETVAALPDETVEDFEKIKRVWRYTYTEEYKNYIFDKFIEHGGASEKLMLPSSRFGWIEPKPWTEGC